MISQFLMGISLISIWISITWALVILFSAIHFWMKHIDFEVDQEPLPYYPKVTIVVPAHNEEIVIAKTVMAILNMNYPVDKINLLLFADNCADNTYQEMQKIKNMSKYRDYDITVINRTGTGGKAGVLNDALKIAQGKYICVYDADAMPENNALYFLIKEVLKNTERHVAAFGRNKTRNAAQNFLTRCINQEIVVTQRIQHVGMWHLFKIGRIPGTNFIISTDFVKSIGGWRNGALTEDTDISFKIMQSGKLIALAYNSEAFQQEPETLKSYFLQRKRWAKGNYEVVISNFKHLFDSSNWRVKLEIFYYTCTFFWFNVAIIVSDIIFAFNIVFLIARFFNANFDILFTFDNNNIYFSQLLLFNWIIMILIYLLQIVISQATQFGQATTKQIAIALVSYFTYIQLFLVLSIVSICSVIMDKILHRDGSKWVKTKRFSS